MPASRPLEERFWEKVDKNGPTQPHMKTPCWVWTGGKDGCGYGMIGRGPGTTMGKAHRISFEWSKGPIPKGLCVLHRCDAPACVRPGHLFLGTQKDNAEDRERKGRSNHPHGDQHFARRTPERLARGERHGNAVLSSAQVAEIRGGYTGRYGEKVALAKKYNVSIPTIKRVLKGQTYGEV